MLLWIKSSSHSCWKKGYNKMNKEYENSESEYFDLIESYPIFSRGMPYHHVKTSPLENTANDDIKKRTKYPMRIYNYIKKLLNKEE
jgi:hypothetical protein